MRIVEFLEQRIAEDEAAQMPAMAGVRGWGKATARRALAECAAKRRILQLHRPEQGDPYGEIMNRVVWWCATCDHDRDYIGIPHAEEWCGTLWEMLQPYSDHPDFDPAWAVNLEDAESASG